MSIEPSVAGLIEERKLTAAFWSNLSVAVLVVALLEPASRLASGEALDGGFNYGLTFVLIGVAIYLQVRARWTPLNSIERLLMETR